MGWRFGQISAQWLRKGVLMKRWERVVAIVGWVGLALGAALGAGVPAQAENEIRQLLQSQQDAWNKGDLEAFMAGYWNSEQLTFYSGGNIQNGWQATIDRYRRRYQSEGRTMGRLTFSEIRIEPLSADSAFARGRWQLEMPDGARPGGLFTLILRKLPQGWRIVHDHTSSQQ